MGTMRGGIGSGPAAGPRGRVAGARVPPAQNLPLQHSTPSHPHPKTKTKHIVLLTVVLVVIISVGIYFLKPGGGGTYAGQATYVAFEADEDQEGIGKWGFDVTEAKGGTTTELYGGEEIEIPVFVDFGGENVLMAGGLRLRASYDQEIVRPVRLVSSMGSDFVAPFDTGVNFDTSIPGQVTVDYVMNPQNPAELTRFTGKKVMFTMIFSVVAPEPEQFQDASHPGAITLVSVLADPNVDVDLGVFGEDGVQLIERDAVSPTVEVVAIPPCYDSDGDGFGIAGKDQRACAGGANDGRDDCVDTTAQCTALGYDEEFCADNDNLAAIHPAAEEICNLINDDCDAHTDEGLDNMGLNVHPDGENEPLAGVCFGYKTCVNGVETNSYRTLGEDDPERMDDPYFGEEVCDAFDNDCDGQLNEGFPGCLSGRAVVQGNRNVGKIASIVPGNVFYDPDDDGGFINPQLLDEVDDFLSSAIDAEWDGWLASECGVPGMLPCGCTELEGECVVEDGPEVLENLHLYYCKSGVYYMGTVLEGAIRDVYKYDPNDRVAEAEGIDAC